MTFFFFFFSLDRSEIENEIKMQLINIHSKTSELHNQLLKYSIIFY